MVKGEVFAFVNAHRVVVEAFDSLAPAYSACGLPVCVAGVPAAPLCQTPDWPGAWHKHRYNHPKVSLTRGCAVGSAVASGESECAEDSARYNIRVHSCLFVVNIRRWLRQLTGE